MGIQLACRAEKHLRRRIVCCINRPRTCFGDTNVGCDYVSMLNETAVTGHCSLISGERHGFYLHVDDGAVLSGSAVTADRLMNRFSDEMEKVGFLI